MEDPTALGALSGVGDGGGTGSGVPFGDTARSTCGSFNSGRTRAEGAAVPSRVVVPVLGAGVRGLQPARKPPSRRSNTLRRIGLVGACMALQRSTARRRVYLFLRSCFAFLFCVPGGEARLASSQVARWPGRVERTSASTLDPTTNKAQRGPCLREPLRQLRSKYAGVLRGVSDDRRRRRRCSRDRTRAASPRDTRAGSRRVHHTRADSLGGRCGDRRARG